MSSIRHLVTFPLVAALALIPAATWSRPAGIREQPEATVRSLYELVVVRRPLGISTYPQYPHVLKLYTPYISERLLHTIKMDRRCEKDWFQRTHGRDRDGSVVKPPFAWLELGLFSGAVEQSWPSQFKIERSEPREDGSTYVYVNLAEWGLDARGAAAPPNKGPPEESWDVAVRVVREGGHLAVDDVVYLKGKYVDAESSLSGYLAMGCRGPHWVGRSS
jgi:hypothetical protein